MWLSTVKPEAEITQHATTQEPLATARCEDACPKSIKLWLLLTWLEENASILVYDCRAVPKSEYYWSESICFKWHGQHLLGQDLHGASLVELIWYLEQCTYCCPYPDKAIEKVGTNPIPYITIMCNLWV
ncbi:hypothetical protein L873DRAFT_1847237 [Choiromyces venosus 120613-1]|uniref:Uncharacterized protein n=1 Tax=Choiromyces venosus 120613-1 TaxID=1336337 RepID=A0A3N4J5E8_9PEZI|nr:hypothetical protein L873DRAFT_1847237 [Choiromyces venosus 120613-1]